MDIRENEVLYSGSEETNSLLLLNTFDLNNTMDVKYT